jgi:redox-sensitive bicupin YhaK (pirin superfamily)
MSYIKANEPTCIEASGPIALVIKPHKKDLGGFTVRRILPSAEHRMVGPFVFFDHMGPAEFPPGEGIQVRPHPHIGIATITYLFEGEIMHRDSLGFVQPIRGGAVNLMTAGRGIVHSERAGEDLHTTSRLHGIQSWIALPTELEEMEPGFLHYAAATLPQIESEGCTVRVIMGDAFGYSSPVTTYSTTLYLECVLQAGAELALPDDPQELAIYVVTGEIQIAGESYPAGVMAVADNGRTIRLRAAAESRVMVIGGDTLGKRTIWWNLVSSSKDRIEQAKLDWKEGRFAMVPGDDEFIPLPE